MGLFWRSKSSKQLAEEAAKQAEHEALQAEVERLNAERTEIVNEQSELRSTVDKAQSEIVTLRIQSEETAEELHRVTSELETSISNLSETQQRLQLLDEANVGMAKILEDKDRQIEQVQQNVQRAEQEVQRAQQEVQHVQSEIEQVQRESAAALHQQDQLVAELEAKLTESTTKATQRIADLETQIAKSNDEAATRIREIEQRLADAMTQSSAQIEKLKEQLAESEARSANRAEQRSALLRNMVEIHRLSATSSKSETSAESLKFVNSTRDEAPKSEETTEESASSGAFYSRSSKWNEQSESESA